MPPKLAQFRAISRELELRVQSETQLFRATLTREKTAVSVPEILSAVEMLGFWLRRCRNEERCGGRIS